MELYHLLIISLPDRRPRHHGAVPPPQESMPYFSTSFGLFFISSLTLALCLCWPFPTVTVSVFSPSRPLPSIAGSTPPLPPHLLISSHFWIPSWSLLSAETEIKVCHSPRVSPASCWRCSWRLCVREELGTVKDRVSSSASQTWLICWTILGVIVYYILISLTVCWNV